MSNESNTFLILEPSWKFDDSSLYLSCSYSFQDMTFQERFDFTFPAIINKSNEEALTALTRLVAIAAGLSYYKALDCLEVKIDFPVNSSIVEWSERLFDEGLREFRVANQINLDQIPDIFADKSVPDRRAAPSSALVERCLVPIGGGKDSATTLEVLSHSKSELVGFEVGDFGSIEETAKVAGLDMVRVKRTIDPVLFELNNKGAPNGHVPVTAITSTLACVAALCINADAVAMSNESSADEPTRIVDGIEVNHQWSKSLAAEDLLRSALSSAGITISYFSLLRGLSEYQIFELFSTFTKYHNAFTSCNRVFAIEKEKRTTSWCGDCDKCRFVFLGLAAFLGPEQATKIVGKNLFKNEIHVGGFLQLLGNNNDKPFECVGTSRESQLFIRNALLWDEAANSVVGKALKKALENTDKTLDRINRSWKNIPPVFIKALRALQEQNYIEHFRSHCEDESFAIVGVGRDTSALASFLATNGNLGSIEVYLPAQNDISDEEFNELLQKNKLESACRFVRVKEPSAIKAKTVLVSPGISKYSDDVVSLGERATTPLAWWLKYNKFHLPDTVFIGVTGTKGKSTTSSMINHVLDNSVLTGNVGHAVGNISVTDIVAAQYIVLEASSYQSSYVTQSPDVVAITSLFDCHIDWHRTPENYYSDKLNLFAHGTTEVVVDENALAKTTAATEGLTLQKVHIVKVASKSLRKRNEEMTRMVVKIVAPSLDDEIVTKRLDKFEDLKYRHEIINEIEGVTYISDVLSTAPEAVLATLDDTLNEYENKIYLLFGGVNSDVDHSHFISEINKRSERVVVIALPETGHIVESDFKNFVHCDELADGVVYTKDNAKAGDVVLLAPGAPSFHAYQNYEELAAHFESLVSQVPRD